VRGEPTNIKYHKDNFSRRYQFSIQKLMSSKGAVVMGDPLLVGLTNTCKNAISEFDIFLTAHNAIICQWSPENRFLFCHLYCDVLMKFFKDIIKKIGKEKGKIITVTESLKPEVNWK